MLWLYQIFTAGGVTPSYARQSKQGSHPCMPLGRCPSQPQENPQISLRPEVALAFSPGYPCKCFGKGPQCQLCRSVIPIPKGWMGKVSAHQESHQTAKCCRKIHSKKAKLLL